MGDAKRRKLAGTYPAGSRLSGQARNCGECTLCCVVLPVLSVGKRGGQPCRHLCGQGCGIYENRPGECAEWRCRWLLGDFTNEDRPDRIGAVPDVRTGTTEQGMGRVARVDVISRLANPIRVRAVCKDLARRYDNVFVNIDQVLGLGIYRRIPGGAPSATCSVSSELFPPRLEDWAERQEVVQETCRKMTVIEEGLDWLVQAIRERKAPQLMAA